MQPVMLFDCRPDAAALAAADVVLASGQLAAGPRVGELERDLGRWIGHEHVATLGDMTHALALALRLSGVGPADDVLTLSYNCMSSNSAITHVGARPVWVDLDPATATMSVADCEAALTSRTKALVAYHVAGYPAPLDELRDFCDRHGLAFIEDANNALGATWKGRQAGTVGDFGVYSFYANRQVNGIDGAALVCADAATVRRIAALRRFGIDIASFRDANGEIDAAADIAEIGMSSSLNHVQAAIALEHLRTLKSRLACNRANVAALEEMLQHTPGLTPVTRAHCSQPAFWTWLVRCEHRNSILAELKRGGIACSKLHQPNHSYSGFAATARALPGTDAFMDEVLALPCGWWLETSDLARIADGVRAACSAAGNSA